MLHLLKNVSANGYFKATAKERKKKKQTFRLAVF